YMTNAGNKNNKIVSDWVLFSFFCLLNGVILLVLMLLFFSRFVRAKSLFDDMSITSPALFLISKRKQISLLLLTGNYLSKSSFANFSIALAASSGVMLVPNKSNVVFL